MLARERESGELPSPTLAPALTFLGWAGAFCYRKALTHKEPSCPTLSRMNLGRCCPPALVAGDKWFDLP